MADTKISALTAATTPLAGTEVLPIVQSGVTKKVAVSDLTAGRAVSGLTFTSTVATGTAPFTVSSTTEVANLTAANATNATTAANLKSNATTGVMQIVGPGAGATRVMTIPNANFTAARTDAGQTFTGTQTVVGDFYVNNSGNTDAMLRVAESATTVYFGGNGTGYPNIWWGVQSATAPGYTFFNDANTGMFRAGADQLAFATGGVLAATIDASQNLSVTGAVTGKSFNGSYIGAGTLRINASQTKTITVAVTGTPNALQIGFGGDLDNNGAFWGVNYQVNGSMVVGSTYSIATTNSYTSSATFTISAVTKNSNNFTFTVTNTNATYGGTIQYYFISSANGAVTVS